MKVLGVLGAVALARANVSPWLVLWWVLIVVWLVVALIALVHYTRRWWWQQPHSNVPAFVVVGTGVGLLVTGLATGLASFP